MPRPRSTWGNWWKHLVGDDGRLIDDDYGQLVDGHQREREPELDRRGRGYDFVGDHGERTLHLQRRRWGLREHWRIGQRQLVVHRRWGGIHG